MREINYPTVNPTEKENELNYLASIMVTIDVNFMKGNFKEFIEEIRGEITNIPEASEIEIYQMILQKIMKQKDTFIES